MKIAVLGAVGNVGSRVVNEALSRGHDVTAVVRDRAQFDTLPANVQRYAADVGDRNAIANLSAGQDVVINATRPASRQEGCVDVTTEGLMDGLAESGVRLLVVGGAATLTVPGTGGKTVLEDENFLPVAARHVGNASARQFDVCLAEKRVDWVYLSPPAQLAPGVRTGVYRTGSDELLLDENGRSAISMEDLAVALLDEAESPKHHRERFTVAY